MAGGQTEAPERLSDTLSDVELRQFWTWFRAQPWRFLNSRTLPRHWDDCRDYHQSRGIRRKSWKATFQKWLRKAEDLALASGAGRMQDAQQPYPHASPPKEREKVSPEERERVRRKLAEFADSIGRGGARKFDPDALLSSTPSE